MITQLNIIKPDRLDSRLAPLSSPLVYLVEATYTGSAPDYIFCEAIYENESLVLMRVPFVYDSETNKRVFRIEADFLKAFLNELDDIWQEVDTIVDSKTSVIFQLVFKSDLSGTIQASVTVEAINAARNADEDVAMQDIINNVQKTYYAAAGKEVYVYYYANMIIIETYYALDFDGEIFTDYNDDRFVID